MTVGELEERMDLHEFRAWQLFIREREKRRAES
jgi:hypothetical protein